MPDVRLHKSIWPTRSPIDSAMRPLLHIAQTDAYGDHSGTMPATGVSSDVGHVGRQIWPLISSVPLPLLFWVMLPLWMAWVFLSLFHDDSVAAAYTVENGVLQNVTVAGYLLATVLFAHAGLQTPSHSPLRRWSLLLLAVGSAFVALEEVNWGQSVLHYSTPAFLEEANLQQEVSLHNLELPGPLAGRHWSNEILWVLTVLGGIVLPMLLLTNASVRRLVHNHGLPVPPWVVQGYCFAAAIIPKDGDLLGRLSRDNIPSELREVTVAVAVAIWAWGAWRVSRSS